jgi:2-C-methyl-D-erythritol 2,4-cyclodiphosphate synthase
MNTPFALRQGLGFDVHAFAPPTPQACVYLGGVAIPTHARLLAHSDGDVLIHALMDALLGALALGDIGQHFPDTNPRYQGADSRQLLAEVMKKLAEKQAKIINVDIAIIAETPKIAPHREAIQMNLAQALQLPKDRLNVKATTTEKLGALGRREGIAVFATVLLFLENEA